MARLRKIGLSYVKFPYQHHQNVVMGAFRYYVIQNEGGSDLEMTTICYVVDGLFWMSMLFNKLANFEQK